MSSAQIPPNIQKAIDDYKKSHPIDKLKCIHFKSIDEFDTSKYMNDLISFPSGGQVGDKEWHTQYQHNLAVMVNYRDKQEVSYAPESYIYLEKYNIGNIRNILYYTNDFLIDKYPFWWIIIANKLFKLKPPLPENINKEYVYFIRTYDLPDNLKKQYKIMIEYTDSNDKIIIEPLEIHFTKYV